MENENDWKLFESTGAVGAYLNYKSHQGPRAMQEGDGDAAADDHGPGAARDQNG